MDSILSLLAACERFADAHERFLIILVTAAIALFTGTLWWATRELQKIATAQLRDMKQSLSTAEMSAETARNQSEAILRAERAYVRMTHRMPGLQIHPEGLGFRVEVEIKNWGRTPATITDAVLTKIVLGERTVLSEVPTYERDDKDDEESIRGILAAGEHVTLNQRFDFTEWEGVNSGKKRIFVVGFVDYIDVFWQRHRAGYAALYYQAPQGKNNLSFVLRPEYTYDRERGLGVGSDWIDFPFTRFDQTLSTKETA